MGVTVGGCVGAQTRISVDARPMYRFGPERAFDRRSTHKEKVRGTVPS